MTIAKEYVLKQILANLDMSTRKAKLEKIPNSLARQHNRLILHARMEGTSAGFHIKSAFQD